MNQRFYEKFVQYAKISFLIKAKKCNSGMTAFF